jgi:soluble lytic murein transglycosylase-like protein
MTAAILGALARIGELTAMTRPAPGFARLLDANAPSFKPAQAAVIGSLPPAASRWTGSIEAAAARHGLDPKLLMALVWTESDFNPSAVSPAGAIGLTQLMPGTALQLGVDPFDPEQNLEGGARFLREMIDRFGRVDLALAAYNAGPSRLSTFDLTGEVPIAQGYVRSVLARQQSIGEVR